MSTKIYDAYRIKTEKGSITLTELMNITQDIKKQIVDVFRVNYVRELSLWVLHRKDLCTFYGDSVFDIVHDKDIVHQLEVILSEKYNDTLLFVNESVIYNKTLRDLPFMLYVCNFLYIPCEDNVLMLYFGDNAYLDIINNSKYFEDFHYQNQHDKPTDITEEEWNYRRDCWDKALAPDFTPTNHGFLFKVIELNDMDLQTKLFLDKDLLTESLEYAKNQVSERVRYIRETIECPVLDLALTKEDEFRIKETQEYQDWKKATDDKIKKKLGLS